MNFNQSRLYCEADDLIRLFKSGQTGQLERTTNILVKRANELYFSVQDIWEEGHIGTGVEMGELVVLKDLCAIMRSYIDGQTTGKSNKIHHEDCLLKDVI